MCVGWLVLGGHGKKHVICFPKIFFLTGSYPGAQDLAQFIPVGQRTTWTFSHLHLATSLTCIATVRGNPFQISVGDQMHIISSGNP